MFPLLTEILDISELADKVLPRLKRVGKEFFWVVAGQAAAALGGLVGIRLLTRALSPAAYGRLALGMTGVMLAQQLILGPLSNAFTRYFSPAEEHGDLDAYLQGSLQLLKKGSVFLGGLLVVLLTGMVARGYQRWISIALGAFVLALLTGYNSALNGIQNAARQRVVVAWHQGIQQWLRFLAALALIGIAGPESSSAIWGFALAVGLVLISQMIFLKQVILPDRKLAHLRGEVPESGEWSAVMYRYARPFMIWGLFSWGQFSSPRWALQFFTASSVVGLYSVLYQLGYYPISLASSLLNRLVSPILFARAGVGNNHQRLRSTHRINLILVILTLVATLALAGAAALFHRWVFSVLVDPQYWGVSGLLPWMVVTGGLFAAAQLATIVFMSDVDTQSLIPPKVSTAVLGIALSFLGGYRFGLRGVVAAQVMTSLVYFLWMLLIVIPRYRSLVGTAGLGERP